MLLLKERGRGTGERSVSMEEERKGTDVRWIISCMFCYCRATEIGTCREEEEEMKINEQILGHNTTIRECMLCKHLNVC